MYQDLVYEISAETSNVLNFLMRVFVLAVYQ